MLFASAARAVSPFPLVIAVATVGIVACGPSATEIKEWGESNAKLRATEPDADLRTWMAEGYECDIIPKDVFLSGGELPAARRAQECFDKTDNKLLAALKAEAAKQEDPAATDAVNQTASCVFQAPKVASPTTYPDIIQRRAVLDVRACIDKKRALLTNIADARKSADGAELAQLEKQDSADAWLTFIEGHRDDKRLPEAAKHVLIIAERSAGDAQHAIDARLVAVYPLAVADLPAERRVLLVGPKGARVRDLQKMAEAKIASSIVIARIRASIEPYKNFDGDEILALKVMGLSDDVVAAMIEVTSKLEDRRRTDDERQAIRAELASLKKMIEVKKAASTDGKTTGEVVQTKDGPMDILASCAKRLGAIKACEQLPFPASNICSSSAESAFPCPKS